jgi:deferrochelatase/peroxidase EfeB
MVELDRRALLSAAGAAGAAALGAGVALDRFVLSDDSQPARVVPFHGTHQAGIATAAQDRLFFAAFDLTTADVSDVQRLLRTWTDAAARMTAGGTAGPHNGAQSAPPEDTGEALGLGPARLTVTFGFGPSFFDDRFGLAARRPGPLVELPPFPGDELDPERSGGDLCVQACADDPQVVFHAVRNLARLARGAAVMRWSQLGFGRTSSTTRSQATPRNLMGFKDGTNNLKAEDTAALRDDVWVDDPSWLRDGTYLVTRRIRMLIEVWDRSTLGDQEQTIGRTKDEGAPLGSRREFDPIRLGALPVGSHVRLAHPRNRILRRGYSFTDGMLPELGQLDAGLFFISFQKDPQQFIDLQQTLGAQDKLNEYIVHTGSALFACPPGSAPGSYVGANLLA